MRSLPGGIRHPGRAYGSGFAVEVRGVRTLPDGGNGGQKANQPKSPLAKKETDCSLPGNAAGRSPGAGVSQGEQEQRRLSGEVPGSLHSASAPESRIPGTAENVALRR